QRRSVSPERHSNWGKGQAAGVLARTNETPLLVRRLYQPKTATAERIWIPPRRVRRSWRPTADLSAAGNWSAGGMRDQRVLTTLRPLRVWRTACPDTTRC